MAPEVMQILVPLLSHCHSAFQDSHDAVPLGPYFPRRGHSLPVVAGKGGARPLRPMVQMTVPHNQLECNRGIDPEYDEALDKFYTPYHDFIDMLFRLAVNNDTVSEDLVNLSAVVGFEAVPLHSTYFPKLWLDILKAQVSIVLGGRTRIRRAIKMFPRKRYSVKRFLVLTSQIVALECFHFFSF
jgi:ubiquitin carboxyl-terminal hydrolase 34